MADKVQVTVDADKFARMAADKLTGGEQVEFEYDSHFGGTKKIAGAVEINHRVLAADTVRVFDRELRGNKVHSVEGNGREVGEVEEATITMNYDDALEEITRHWDYDVDDAGDEIYVQMWDEADGKLGTREVTMHRVKA